MNFKKYGPRIILGFLLITALIFYVVYNENDDLLKVTFLNVGDGHAIFIRSPNGNQFLINAGSDTSILRALGRVIPFYDRTIDAVFLTDGDQASIGGMPEVLKNYTIKTYIESAASGHGVAYHEMENEITKKNIKTDFIRSGSIVDLGGNAYLRILFINDDTKAGESMVAQIVYGDSTFLIMPNNISTTIENYLAGIFQSKLKSTVFEAPHSGAKNYLSDTFLSAVAPEFSIISVNKNNKNGYPVQETLDALLSVKSIILETYNGDISFVSNGQNTGLSN